MTRVPVELTSLSAVLAEVAALATRCEDFGDDWIAADLRWVLSRSAAPAERPLRLEEQALTLRQDVERIIAESYQNPPDTRPSPMVLAHLIMRHAFEPWIKSTEETIESLRGVVADLDGTIP